MNTDICLLFQIFLEAFKNLVSCVHVISKKVPCRGGANSMKGSQACIQ